MGDAFVDIRSSYNSGSIPILYTEIKRDVISPKNLERLPKLNPDNPIIILNRESDFIELLEKSKKYGIKKKVLK